MPDFMLRNSYSGEPTESHGAPFRPHASAYARVGRETEDRTHAPEPVSSGAPDEDVLQVQKLDQQERRNCGFKATIGLEEKLGEVVAKKSTEAIPGIMRDQAIEMDHRKADLLIRENTIKILRPEQNIFQVIGKLRKF